jgi:hypothetical protein
VGAIFVALNLLGRTAVEVQIAGSTRTGASSRVVQSREARAGWPWPYLQVTRDRLWPLAHLEDGVRWFSTPALLGDLLVLVAVASGGGWLLAQRFSSRRRWWQFGLLDLAAATTLVAAALGWGYLPRLRHARESRVIANRKSFGGAPRYWPVPSGDSGTTVVWQPGPMDRLRELVGERWLPETSHIVAIETFGVDVRDVIRLSKLRVVRIHGEVSDVELNLLAGLQELEALDITEAMLRKDRGGWLDTPDVKLDYALRLPRLKRLVAHFNVLQGSDLADFAELEELHLAGSVLDDASIEAICRLKKLRVLDLRHTALDDAGLAKLAALEELQQLAVFDTTVTASGLAKFDAARPDCVVRP